MQEHAIATTSAPADATRGGGDKRDTITQIHGQHRRQPASSGGRASGNTRASTAA